MLGVSDLEFTAGLLVFVALVVGVIIGVFIQSRATHTHLDLLAEACTSLDTELKQANKEVERKQSALEFERATTKALTEQLRKVSDQAKEAGLKVVATVTGPNSMNIAGGYRYDTNNS